ncbi:hypothetical protein OG819_28730 [Streptomyces sp. NBC_01549]|nr:hypothetical protein [Streptomyces sp. NBC_01549]MCX4593592.1 hypothetical protein [Streptomyces sp. NBC_01549]
MTSSSTAIRLARDGACGEGLQTGVPLVGQRRDEVVRHRRLDQGYGSEGLPEALRSDGQFHETRAATTEVLGYGDRGEPQVDDLPPQRTVEPEWLRRAHGRGGRLLLEERAQRVPKRRLVVREVQVHESRPLVSGISHIL